MSASHLRNPSQYTWNRKKRFSNTAEPIATACKDLATQNRLGVPGGIGTLPALFYEVRSVLFRGLMSLCLWKTILDWVWGQVGLRNMNILWSWNWVCEKNKWGEVIDYFDQSLETCQRNGAWNRGPSDDPISPRISRTVAPQKVPSQSVIQGLPDKFQK